MSADYCLNARITAPDISHGSLRSCFPTCYPDPAGLLYLSQSGLQPHKAMCWESKCKGKPLSLPCLETLMQGVHFDFVHCHLSLRSSSLWWRWVQCVVCPQKSPVPLPTNNGRVDEPPTFANRSRLLSCISFPPGDESDKARTVQASSYLPCSGPPPLYSSLLAPVHTGSRTGLPQAWAAQLSRSLTSVTYLRFIGQRPRGQSSTNVGKEFYSLHPMCSHSDVETNSRGKPALHRCRYTNDITECIDKNKLVKCQIMWILM